MATFFSLHAHVHPRGIPISVENEHFLDLDSGSRIVVVDVVSGSDTIRLYFKNTNQGAAIGQGLVDAMAELDKEAASIHSTDGTSKGQVPDDRPPIEAAD